MELKYYREEIVKKVKRVKFNCHMKLENLDTQFENELNKLDTQMNLKFEYNSYKFKSRTSGVRVVSFEMWIREKLLEFDRDNRYFIESVRTATVAVCNIYGLGRPQFEVTR